MERRDFPLPTLKHSSEGASWLQNHLRHIKKTKDVTLSPFGVLVADILGYLYGGLYHTHRQINWERWGSQFSDDAVIELVVPASGGWATYDNDMLTKLVLIGAATGVRIEVNPVNRRYFRLYFHRRYSQHLPENPLLGRYAYAYLHPTLEQAVQQTNEFFAVEWQRSPVLEPQP